MLSNTLPAKTPDLTPAQIAAAIKFAIAVTLALGLHINRHDQEVLIASAGLVCTAIVIADAIIRRGRAGAMAALAQPGLTAEVYKEILEMVKAGKVTLSEDGVSAVEPTDKAAAPTPFTAAAESGFIGEDPAALHAASGPPGVPTGRPYGMSHGK